MTLKELSQWFWSDDFWLPPNITWDHLVDKSEDPNIRFPSSSDLFYPIPMALVLIVIRYLVENQVGLFTQSQKYMTSLVTYSLLICCCLSDNLTIVFFLMNSIEGSFTNYVNKILPKIDHLPTPYWHTWRNSFTEIFKGNLHTVDLFSTGNLPCLVNIVCECPLVNSTIITLHHEVLCPSFALKMDQNNNK